MFDWVSDAVAVAQLVLNVAAVAGGAVVWKLYVDKLRATVESKDATIETVEKSRDFWKDKAEELEKRRPEVLEVALSERIRIRDGEIERLKADKEVDQVALRNAEMSKAALEQDLARTQGFRTMLELEDAAYDEAEGDVVDDKVSGEGEEILDQERAVASSEVVLAIVEPLPVIEVELIGEVAVDSGQLMVTDPCYVDPEWRDESFSALGDGERAEETLFTYSYDGACQATLTGGGHGELAFTKGHAGAAVAFSTAWGDGFYPVYAEKHDGRVVRVYVNVG